MCAQTKVNVVKASIFHVKHREMSQHVIKVLYGWLGKEGPYMSTHDCWMSSSSVQRDPVGGGVASRRFPDGGLFGPWGVAVHGEEETVVQLVKRVRMPPSAVVFVGVVFVIGGDGGASLAPFVPGETSHPGEATIDNSACGCRSPC
jgi:hypothetical protein